jgi:hypothetical protein
MMEKSPYGILLLVFVFSGFAPGKIFAQEGPTQIEKAVSAFAELDFEGALEKLELAQEASGNKPGDLVRIHSLRGLCLVALNKSGEATQAFTAALSIDPAFRLDGDLSPRYQEPFQQLLEKGVPALAVDIDVPRRLTQGDPVTVGVELKADPAGISHKLVFRHRRRGQPRYSAIRVKLKKNKTVSFYLPPGIWSGQGTGPIEWYAQLLDRFGGLLLTKGDRDHPVIVPVQDRKPTGPVLPTGSVVAATPRDEEEPAWYQRWWVWAIIGGTAAAVGGTAAAITLSRESPDHRDFSLEIR